MNFIENIQKQVNDTVETIINTIKVEFPSVTGILVKDIFDTKGTIDNRNWAPNAKSTIARKKHDNPNVDTGLLETTLSQPSFILDDNYMGNLPKPPKGRSNGYLYANKMRKFDDIGRTPEDEKILEQKLEEKILNAIKK